jgi:hypothetical protein
MALVYKIADIKDAWATQQKIRIWTGDDDYILAVRYQVGGWTIFSNSLFADQPAESGIVRISYDPPGDIELPPPGPSQHTYFDEQSLSSRDEGYQTTAVNFFADYVLANYLRVRTYVVDPSSDVRDALDGRLPETRADIAKMIQKDDSLLDKVRCVEREFSPEQLSPGARQAIRSLLENRDSLESFLENPEKFIGEYQQSTEYPIKDEEADALVRAAREQPEVVAHVFDSVELGRSTIGDGNAYILIGIDEGTGLPNKEGMRWYLDQLDNFVELNGFVPGIGFYVTEASLRHSVILGPGVSDRAREYLKFIGHEIVDHREGQPFTEPLRPSPGQQVSGQQIGTPPLG